MPEEDIFVQPCDIRHRGHYHCGDGVRRVCARTGIDYGRLMAGQVTAAELLATGNALAMEVARNAMQREADNGERR